MTARHDCRVPDACRAKGDRLCRSCAASRSGRASIERLHSDPDLLRRLGEQATPRLRDPDFIARRNALYRRNKAWRRQTASAGRAKCQEINADPDLTRKRIEAMKASVAGRVARNAVRLAAKAGIPVDLVPEYRRLRWTKDYGQSQAVAVLRASHPSSFEAIDAEAARAAYRSAGPMPAVGTPERAAWIRQAVEGDSCRP